MRVVKAIFAWTCYIVGLSFFYYYGPGMEDPQLIKEVQGVGAFIFFLGMLCYPKRWAFLLIGFYIFYRGFTAAEDRASKKSRR